MIINTSDDLFREETPKNEFVVKEKPTEDEITQANRDIDLIRKKNTSMKQNRIFFERMLKKHIRGDRDYMICASSFEGEGKSRMVNQLGTEICRCYTKEQKLHFLSHNVVYDPTGGELIRVLKNIKPYSILLVDEAQKLLYKRNYNTAERKALNILFSTIREKKLIVIFCIPDFYDLDVYFRNWRIKTWIYIPIRGRAIVFKKSNSPFSKDKWEQKNNQKLIEEYENQKNEGRLLSKTGIIQALRKLKSYGFEFEFEDWDDVEVKKQYLQYKDWGGTTPPAEEVAKAKSELEKKKLIAQKLFAKGCSTNEISEIMEISLTSVRDYVREIRNELKPEVKEEFKPLELEVS